MLRSIKSYRWFLQGVDSNAELVRRHKDWPGKNVFLCGGTIFMGVHWEHLACSLVLIILSFCQYLLLIQPFIHHDFLILCAVGVGTSNIVLLLMTALSDPGIRPRQLFRTDMATSVGLIKKDATILKSNFCKVCNIWRPSRTRHCKFCDNCVDIFDHHCPWTGTCIGVRNYPPFIVFVTSILVTSILFLVSALYILLGWLLLGAYTNLRLLRLVALVLNIVWSCIVLSAVGVLLLFHVCLIIRGQTTNEYFRGKRAQELKIQESPAPKNETTSKKCCFAPAATASYGVQTSTTIVTLPPSIISTGNSLQGSTEISFDTELSATTATTQNHHANGVLSTSPQPVTTKSTSSTPIPYSDPRNQRNHQCGHNTEDYHNQELSPLPMGEIKEEKVDEEDPVAPVGGELEKGIMHAAERLMALTPMYNMDETPFPQLSPTPSPYSPTSPMSPSSPSSPFAQFSSPVFPGFAHDHQSDNSYNSVHTRFPRPHTDALLEQENRSRQGYTRVPWNAAAAATTTTTTTVTNRECNSQSYREILDHEARQEEASSKHLHDALTHELAVEKKVEVQNYRAARSNPVLQFCYCCCILCSGRLSGHRSGNNKSTAVVKGKDPHHHRYDYCCFCCIPIIPASRLLPMWQRHGPADLLQRYELLDELFQRISEATQEQMDATDLESGNVSV